MGDIAKVVTHFRYMPEDAAHGTEVLIPVQLEQSIKREKIRDEQSRLAGKKHRSPGQTTHATFRVDVDKPVAIDITCTDIEVLRRLVFDKLDEGYALPWERYLHVSVSEGAIYTGVGTDLEIRYNEVEIAKMPDGTEVYRDSRRSDKVQMGRPEIGEHRGTSHSLVRNTKENKKALNEFIARIKSLRERITEFLSQDTIQRTLANMQNLPPMLPPADPKPPPGRVKVANHTKVD